MTLAVRKTDGVVFEPSHRGYFNLNDGYYFRELHWVGWRWLGFWRRTGVIWDHNDADAFDVKRSHALIF